MQAVSAVENPANSGLSRQHEFNSLERGWDRIPWLERRVQGALGPSLLSFCSTILSMWLLSSRSWDSCLLPGTEYNFKTGRGKRNR